MSTVVRSRRAAAIWLAMVDRRHVTRIARGENRGIELSNYNVVRLLKRIGTRARAELEELLEHRVYLRLWVKVRGHWRENEGILKRLGVWDG